MGFFSSLFSSGIDWADRPRTLFLHASAVFRAKPNTDMIANMDALTVSIAALRLCAKHLGNDATLTIVADDAEQALHNVRQEFFCTGSTPQKYPSVHVKINDD